MSKKQEKRLARIQAAVEERERFLRERRESLARQQAAIDEQRTTMMLNMVAVNPNIDWAQVSMMEANKHAASRGQRAIY
jgi:hypothetical protein